MNVHSHLCIYEIHKSSTSSYKEYKTLYPRLRSAVVKINPIENQTLLLLGKIISSMKNERGGED